MLYFRFPHYIGGRPEGAEFVTRVGAASKTAHRAIHNVAGEPWPAINPRYLVCAIQRTVVRLTIAEQRPVQTHLDIPEFVRIQWIGGTAVDRHVQPARPVNVRPIGEWQPVLVVLR